MKNKNKLLLATLSIPVIVAGINTEDVKANQVPILNITETNGLPTLSWATEILTENLITKENFEGNNIIFGLNSNYSQLYPNKEFQKVVSNVKYEGNKSLWLDGTTNGRGNYYNAEIVRYGDTSSFSSKERFILPDNSNISISMKVKAKSDVQLDVNIYDLTTDYGTPIGVTMKNNVSAGTKSFYVNNVQNVRVGMYLLTNKNFSIGQYKQSYVESVNYQTGLVTLKYGLSESFNAGEEVKQHTNPSSGLFKKEIESSDDWQLINLNSSFGNPFHSASRGNNLLFTYTSEQELYIDDIQFGYATEVEVFRDNESIYRGYLSDFQDTSFKDTVKPNTVNKINTTVSNDLKVQFVPIKPLDNKIKTKNYTIQSISKNGNRSAMSAPQSIDIVGEVVKYKYTINSNNNTPTTLANTTNNLEFNIPINQLNLENDYIHIQAIDGANNQSEITTYKLKDIVNMNIVNDLYDKLDKVENSMNYNEFIEFIEEVESMYGTNIPLDVKNKIQELAAYHNANTAFLLLLEGDFILTTSDITSFGKTKLTAKKQVLYTNFVKEFNIIDARGTQQGYSITVSATPFIEDTFDGFIGQPVQLPIGTLALNPVSEINQIGLVHNSQKPTPQTINSTIIDSGSVNVLQAGKGQGMGEFVFNFGDKPLSMVVDSTTAKIDNVNYPSGTTPYTSTITWNLITGP